MEECKIIRDEDYGAFEAIMNDYLPGNSAEKVLGMYRKYRDAFVGYYKEDNLIGICYGWPRSEEVAEDSSFSIVGIAIVHPNHAQGRGAKLLSYFEQKVKEMGFTKVSVGSADGYVEKFYMQNGYIPKEYKVLRDGQDTYVHLLSSPMDYERLNKEEILRQVDGYHGFIVFEKTLV